MIFLRAISIALLNERCDYILSKDGACRVLLETFLAGVPLLVRESSTYVSHIAVYYSSSICTLYKRTIFRESLNA